VTAPLHLDLETEIRELFETTMRNFVEFCATNWCMTAAEAETLTEPTANPAEYARGYTAAMQTGLEGALAFWLDDMGYGQ